MNTKVHSYQRSFLSLVTGLMISAISISFLAGCSTEHPEFLSQTKPPEFRLNAVEARKLEINVLKDEKFSEAQLQNVSEILTALFGTPDQPRFPYEVTEEPDYVRELINPDHLNASAGRVSSDKLGAGKGLYRKHCAHCHGVTGGGLGPTAAILNPYPRDFRMGKFKFKSTKIGRTPTKADLRRILMEGIPGTAMPSFKLLVDAEKPEEKTSDGNAKQDSTDQNATAANSREDEKPKKIDEIDALVDYVIYLSIRGQVERILLDELTAMGSDLLLETKFADSEDDEEIGIYEGGLDLMYGVVGDEVGFWLDTLEQDPKYAARPASLELDSPERAALIDRGRELFLGKANCFSCHGSTSLGDGQTDKYDQWTDDWLSAVKNSEKRLEEFKSLGALPPRKIRPRNLRQGVFRGGQRPIDVFMRIKNGIDGTPMPAAPVGMTDDDLWAITEYVRQLHSENSVHDSEKKVNKRVVN